LTTFFTSFVSSSFTTSLIDRRIVEKRVNEATEQCQMDETKLELSSEGGTSRKFLSIMLI